MSSEVESIKSYKLKRRYRIRKIAEGYVAGNMQSFEIKIILIFAAVFFSSFYFAIPCFATDRYIDCSAPTNGIGTQESPWNAIANIGGMTAGDDLYFKRGTTCTLSTSWTPLWDGEAGNPAIFGAYGNGARPIITGNNTAASVMLTKNKGVNYYTIEHLDLRNSVSPVINCYEGCNNFVIDDCYLSGSQNSHGLYFNGTYLTLKNSVIHSNGLGDFNGNHGIYIGNSATNPTDHVLIENNHFYGNSESQIKINDGAVAHRQTDIVIRYNLIGHGRTVGTPSYGNAIDDYSSDGILIYYNVFYPYGNYGGWTIWFSSSGLIPAINGYVYNNVIYHSPTTGSGVYAIYQQGSGNTGFTYKNNIIYTNAAGKYLYTPSGSTITACDHNIWYGGTTAWVYNGTTYNSLSSWNAVSIVGTDIQSDPLFVNAAAHDYTPLNASSPVVDGAADWGQTRDFLGTTKQGSAWDIGAYEYVGAADTIPPAAPSGVVVS